MAEATEGAGPFDFNEYAIAYLIAFVLYNVSEGLFRPHNFLYVVLFLFVTDYPSEARMPAVVGIGGIGTPPARKDNAAVLVGAGYSNSPRNEASLVHTSATRRSGPRWTA
jgi:hypothetical protein